MSAMRSLLALSLVFFVGVVVAYPEGSPSCEIVTPTGHGDSIVKAEDLKLLAHKTESQAANAKNLWILTLNRPTGELKGLLIRPEGSTKGKFVEFDKSHYQVLEDGKCVTHKENNEKSGVQTFQYQAEGTDVPKFDVFVVGKTKEEWWKTEF